jgi:hypothetical protein
LWKAALKDLLDAVSDSREVLGTPSVAKAAETSLITNT